MPRSLVKRRDDDRSFTPIVTFNALKGAGASPGAAVPSQPVAPTTTDNTSQASRPRTDLDHLEEFFRYCLPPLVPHKTHKPSTSTRAPAPFDQHLDERLQLKRVVYLPSLTTDLEEVVDDALKCYLEKHGALPPVSGGGSLFPDHKARHRALVRSRFHRITCEPSLQSTYEGTILNPCSIVASTLELHLPHWCNGHLEYFSSPETNEAIGDGFLKLVEEQSPLEQPVPPLSGEYSYIMSDFPVLAVLEFKSLYSGSDAVFQAVVAHAELDEFPWVTCSREDLCLYKCRQSSTNRVPDAPIVEWAPMGFDAEEPVCKSIQSPRTHTTPPRSGPHSHSNMKHATWMIQQVWAELVVNDATLACLTSGTRSIVMERCRAEGTLSISEIFHSKDVGHAKVMTGFFIASLRDARQRAAQLRFARRNLAEPVTWRRPSALDPWGGKSSKEVQGTILHEAFTRNWLVMNPMPHNRGAKEPCYPFVANSPYFRISSSILSRAEPVIAPKFGPFFRIHPHPRISTSKATIRVMGRQFTGLPTFSKSVYAKSAGEKRASERLWHESRIYSYLERENVIHIPRVFGFFRHANLEGITDPLPFVTLVLEHAGTSVADNKLVITAELIEECREALRQIHDANICHGSISLHRILVRDPQFLQRTLADGEAGLPRVSVVGFGSAYWSNNDEQKKSELLELVQALQEPYKKRRLEEDSVEDKRHQLETILRDASAEGDEHAT
ncbi:hypothetical protein LshimejAT787_1300910 [Lyophyllum shimeji]|uniref:Protein kinase domain-containing protein n=1 Tax=Lyophyllum shimeji TaxID=47721 RepID=A0A9P3PWA9_LYOSH|nr:hypothetical protein LshimejAT787_1300910 [Lyophyllum shimeji]